jgi:uncharacterized protein DUF6328
VTEAIAPPERDDDLGGLPDESQAERLNRNLTELLGELRVVLPGVQVLFAFLLTVPFAQGFASISQFDRVLYLVVLLATAIASALLMAPSAFHRLVFRKGMKRELVFFANRVVLAGLAFMAMAMIGALLLVSNVIFGTATAIVVAISAAALFGGLWWAYPLSRS